MIKLRARHKMMIIAALCGAIVTAIPFVCRDSFKSQGIAELTDRLEYYENLEAQYSYTNVCVLTRDVVAGDILTEEMFRIQRIQSTDDLTWARMPAAEDYVGKRCKLSLKKGAMLSEEMMYEGTKVADDERYVELRALSLPQMLQKDEFVDVRIVFPNGEDYLVVGHKRVYRLIKEEEVIDALQLRLSEEELIRYQAACIDAGQYENTRLYAVQYTGEYQAAAEAYYPVNSDVFELLQWNPNIAELFLVEAEQARRALLESHLKGFLMDKNETLTQADEMDSEVSDTDLSLQTKEPLTLYTGLPEES